MEKEKFILEIKESLMKEHSKAITWMDWEYLIMLNQNHKSKKNRLKMNKFGRGMKGLLLKVKRTELDIYTIKMVMFLLVSS